MESLIVEGFSLEEKVRRVVDAIKKLTTRVEKLEQCQNCDDPDEEEDCWGLGAMTD